MEDAQVFSSLKYDKNRFVVVVLKRAPPPPQPEPTPEPKKEEVAANTSSSLAPTPPKEAANIPATPANRAPPISTPQAPARNNTAPRKFLYYYCSSMYFFRFSVSEENQEKLNTIVAMGYPESEALPALRAAFFDAERAVEYLINGVPDTVRAEGGYDVAMEGGDDDEGEHVGLEFLQDNEQFQQLRDMLRANPDMLPEIMQQIAQDNPALMQLIRENEEQFLTLLNEDAAVVEADAQAQGAPPQNLPPNAIAITQADREAITRVSFTFIYFKTFCNLQLF